MRMNQKRIRLESGSCCTVQAKEDQNKGQGWKSLAGYSPWGHKESDTTERPSTLRNKIILDFPGLKTLKTNIFSYFCAKKNWDWAKAI